MGDMETFHRVGACKIANDGDDVRNGTSFPASQFYQVPALIVAICADNGHGKQNSKEIDKRYHLQLVKPRKEAQIAEAKECQQPYQREIEGIKHGTEQTGCPYQTLLLGHR